MSANIPPTCPDTHIFNQMACLCEPKKKALKGKKHKKKLILTAKHKKKLPLPKTPLPKTQKTKKIAAAPTKRCPNGTRRDKKTGECVSQGKTLKKKVGKKTMKPVTKREKVVTVEDATPLEDRYISNAISNVLKASKTKKPSSFIELHAKIRDDLVQNHSFSPSVNKRLVSLRNIKNTSIFGCGLEDVLHGKVAASAKNLKIKMGVSATGKPICVSYKNEKARKLMLNNLAASKSLACGKVVSPLQLQTNCWFNTMYMAFFISDKGRKFFRFFRQLMIEGQQENGTKISPPRLAQAFLLFNAYIESSYNLDDSSKTIMAEGMDTNILIDAIYKSIPKKYKMGGAGFRSPGEYGNPLQFYQSIILYLSNNSIRFFEPDPPEIPSLLVPRHSYRGSYYMPDVIVVKLYDNFPMFKSMVISDTVTTRQPSFTRVYAGHEQLTKGQPKEAKYVLDSAIVRSTNTEHFCALITCNGKQMAFDGGSLVRLGVLQWKSMLNKNAEWIFPTVHGKSDPLKWNFMRSYQQLYYYRV